MESKTYVIVSLNISCFERSIIANLPEGPISQMFVNVLYYDKFLKKSINFDLSTAEKDIIYWANCTKSNSSSNI
jgi:hypothetical protein